MEQLIIDLLLAGGSLTLLGWGLFGAGREVVATAKEATPRLPSTVRADDREQALNQASWLYPTSKTGDTPI